jgi:hypothetical protein
MAIAVLFTPPAMSTEQYDEIMRRLDAAGQNAPQGRLQHLCFGEGSNLKVLDVWDSPETFGAFGQTLIPIVQDVGVDPGQPLITPMHNQVEG